MKVGYNRWFQIAGMLKNKLNPDARGMLRDFYLNGQIDVPSLTLYSPLLAHYETRAPDWGGYIFNIREYIKLPDEEGAFFVGTCSVHVVPKNASIPVLYHFAIQGKVIAKVDDQKWSDQNIIFFDSIRLESEDRGEWYHVTLNGHIYTYRRKK